MQKQKPKNDDLYTLHNTFEWSLDCNVNMHKIVISKRAWKRKQLCLIGLSNGHSDLQKGLEKKMIAFDWPK
jgi:hypothetical protein